jgi:hypothetical protein
MGERIKLRMTLRCTADHEAAHAVLSERYDLRVRRVFVRMLPSGNWVGATVTAGNQLVHPIPTSVVSLAGSVSEALWHGHERDVVNGGDFRDLIRTGMPTHEDMTKNRPMQWAWSLLFRLTEAEVKRNKTTILRVSAALQRKKKLTGDEVRALMKRRR